MLGQTLIQADKDKFKGGYLKLFKNIKQTKKDYKIIKQLLSDFNIISPIVYNAIADNKTLFINNFENIKDILNTHKDYQAIIDNIFHNFNYFLNHLDLIKEWLLSDDFNERYKKENHPYPSLLDPKKLNDENEEINYNNIPAELAWEMNLPLPDRYKFVLIAPHANGQNALRRFLEYTNLNKYFYKMQDDGFKRYIAIYKTKNTYISCTEINFKNSDKFYFLIQNNKNILRLVRDPISVINCVVSTFRPIKNKQYNINNYTNLDNIFNQVKFGVNLDKPNINDVGNYINTTFENHTYKYFEGSYIGYLCLDKLQYKEVTYIEFDELNFNNSYNSILKLGKKFNFEIIKPNHYFKQKVYGYFSLIFPINLLYKTDQIYIDFLITSKHQFDHLDNAFIKNRDFNINDNLDLKFNIIDVYINKNDLKYLKSNFYLDIKKYFNYFEYLLYNKSNSLEKIKYKEKDILFFLKNDKTLMKKLKQILDKELEHIKQHRPDIVASWKYYQEFEKMCEELN